MEVNNEMVTQSTIGNDKKFYSKMWIVIGTLIGGPLAGCYYLSRNFKSLGNSVLAKTALLTGIYSTLLVFGLVVLIPKSLSDRIPSYTIPLVYTILIYQYFV